jgi:hypothetical protein
MDNHILFGILTDMTQAIAEKLKFAEFIAEKLWNSRRN